MFGCWKMSLPLVLWSLCLADGLIMQFKPKGATDDDDNRSTTGHDIVDSTADWPGGDHNRTIVLLLPKRVDVVAKEFNGASEETGSSWYVDRVYTPRYHRKVIDLNDYSRLDRGAVDLRVVVNYCDCRPKMCAARDRRRARRPKTVELDYVLYFYVFDDSVYISTSVSGERVDDGGDGFTDVPDNLIGRWDTYRNFGPFRTSAAVLTTHRTPSPPRSPVYRVDDGTIVAAPDGTRITTMTTTTEQQVKLLDDGAVKEWAAFEVSGDIFKRYVWNRNSDGRRTTTTSGAKTTGNDVRVTLSPGYVESFDGIECRDLDDRQRGNVSSDSMVVDRGGCVNAYRGKGCTGAKRIVFEERQRLYSDRDDAQLAPLTDVGSVASCWRDMTADGMPDPYAFHGAPRTPDTKYGLTGRPSRSCGPCPSATTTGRYLSTNASGQYRRTTIPPPTILVLNAVDVQSVLDELAEWNKTAAVAADLALENSVAVITAETAGAAAAAMAMEVAAARIVVRSAHRTMALIDYLSAPLHDALDRLGRRLLEESAEDTEKYAEYAATTVAPENVTYTALSLGLSTTCAQAFLSSAISTVASNIEGQATSADDLDPSNGGRYVIGKSTGGAAREKGVPKKREETAAKATKRVGALFFFTRVKF